MDPLVIAGRPIGPHEPPYIIAEIGANHNGDMNLCRRLVDAAVECGVDAVKFQSWSKSSLIARAEYERNTQYAPDGTPMPTLEAAVTQYQFTPAAHREIAAYCRQRGTVFLSSCFAPQEVDLLASLDVPAYKIASMDVNHLALLAYVAQQGRPVILSTGMATLGEIERALDVLHTYRAPAIALLHCVALYPTPPADVHLRNIALLQQAFGLPVGFSDHTLGTAIPLAAVAQGACIIEKHFTLDTALPGWDHALSADPAEMGQLVRDSRQVFSALGRSVRTVSAAEAAKRQAFRRCIVAKHTLHQGATLEVADLDFKRPGTGIHPDELPYVLHRTLTRDLAADEALAWADLA